VSGAIAGNTYILAIKYSTKSIVGTTPGAATVTYTFATNLNGGGTLAGSTQSLMLVTP